MGQNPMHADYAPEENDPNTCPKCGFAWAVHNGDGSCGEDGELTDTQLARQEDVDNVIYEMMLQVGGTFVVRQPYESLDYLVLRQRAKSIPWDIGMIAAVRETIQKFICEKVGMTEMDFYPYLESGE